MLVYSHRSGSLRGETLRRKWDWKVRSTQKEVRRDKDQHPYDGERVEYCVKAWLAWVGRGGSKLR